MRAPKTVGDHLKQFPEYDALNRSLASVMSDCSVAGSKTHGKRSVATSSSSSDEDKMPNLVASNPWERNRPGSARTGNDGFTVIRRRNGK